MPPADRFEFGDGNVGILRVGKRDADREVRDRQRVGGNVSVRAEVLIEDGGKSAKEAQRLIHSVSIRLWQAENCRLDNVLEVKAPGMAAEVLRVPEEPAEDV